VGEVEVEGDFGEAGKEVFGHDVEVVGGEAWGGGDAEEAAGSGDVLADGGFEGLDFAEDVGAAFAVGAACFGEAQ
jgi:hypothetical protein